MGLQLPEWLTEPLSWVGLEWPQADEVKLFEAGQAWMAFAFRLQPIAAHANSAAADVWSNNEGPASDEFKRWWEDEDGPTKRLRDDQLAALLIGGALMIFAAITLVMKIMFIVQLIILAVQVAMAIAAAFATFGASTATVPGFIAATRIALTRLIRKVVDDVIKKSIKKLLDKAKQLLKKVRQIPYNRAVRKDPRFAVLIKSRRQTHIGEAFYTPNDPSWSYLAKQPGVPGHHTINMHGSHDRVAVGDVTFSAKDLANFLRSKYSSWDGQPINLMSCSAGKGDNPIAQQLANILGVPVRAGSDIVWLCRDGSNYVSSWTRNKEGRRVPTWPPDGTWVTFFPSRRKG